MNPWRVVVGLVALAGIAFGVFAIASPGAVVAFADSVLTSSGLWVIAAIRVALGIVLLLAAPGARMPRVVRAVGIIIVVAGLVTPLFGLERTRAVMAWEVSWGPKALRAIGLVIVALSGMLIYITNPSRRTV